jgi:16S rRNA (uracil1498-N3)-methyltransferase
VPGSFTKRYELSQRTVTADQHVRGHFETANRGEVWVRVRWQLVAKEPVDPAVAELPGRQADAMDDDQLQRRADGSVVAVRRGHVPDALKPPCGWIDDHSRSRRLEKCSAAERLCPHYISRHGTIVTTPVTPMTPRKRRITRLFVARELHGDTLPLDQNEAHYLGHVLRLQRGDELIAFNGRGEERHARVGSLQRRGALLELRAAHPALPESPLTLTLVQALPKADAMDLIVQKATELGARAIVPVFAEFSVVRLDGARSDRRLEHWRRIAQSACEQCGRHTPPEIAAPAPLDEAVGSLPDATTKAALDPTAAQRLAAMPRPTARLALAIGPEGGFSAADWRLLDAGGFAHVALGPRVLRAETAAVTAISIAQAEWGDL